MSKRILIIEDSKIQALKLQLRLQDAGLAVDVAANGQQGFFWARADLPTVIILDGELSDLDGYALCRDLKSDPATAHIPIIMLTGAGSAAAAGTGADLGPDVCIPRDEWAVSRLAELLRRLEIL